MRMSFLIRKPVTRSVQCSWLLRYLNSSMTWFLSDILLPFPKQIRMIWTAVWSFTKMERKRGKYWKMPIFEGKLQVIFTYLSEMKTVSMLNPLILLLFTDCFYHAFFVLLEIFKFKYDKFFFRHSASISKFKWFEQPCMLNTEQQPCKKNSFRFFFFQGIWSVFWDF